ncbi:membrane protein [Pseudooceanicola antarcticus]|uniref:Membrane protein n=1 Tax=Pseudooceanicola antarcticus TaxID=1247613 RepID=A0A285I102_9RHOB|nr:YihY/virulence factor BrkB family protein [Pseudooceanicola antarcticus]PJE30258.1 YihY/virulence factor BrkB family protein [Pseudooceanicola antarcticus]SNY41629.1 membrane protein [Pseudooceanicola antarcticus]
MAYLKTTWAVLVGIFLQIGEINMALVAAGVAFYAMLALFPGIAALIALWGIISDPSVVMEQLKLTRNIMPDEVYTLVAAQVYKISASSGSTLGWAGVASLAVAIWSSRSGVAAMILGLNTIHGQENRGSLRHYLIALLLTVALLGVGLVALASVVVLPIVLTFIPLGPVASIAVEALRLICAVVAVMVGLSLLYRFGPNNRGERMSWATPGALLSVVLWMGASYGLSLYFTNFANYNEVYGSLGAAMALLFWLYVSAFVVLLGASLNVQLDRARAQAAGSPDPAPQRGKADTVLTGKEADGGAVDAPQEDQLVEEGPIHTSAELPEDTPAPPEHDPRQVKV